MNILLTYLSNRKKEGTRFLGHACVSVWADVHANGHGTGFLCDTGWKRPGRLQRVTH